MTRGSQHGTDDPRRNSTPPPAPPTGAPIVSISLGLSAVYLLGGPSKAEAPLALLVRSGDVIVQGGASRGHVHGVPRILAGSSPAELRGECDGAAGDETEELRAVAEWLGCHRLNVNVRQVFEHAEEEEAAAAAGAEPGGRAGKAARGADAHAASGEVAPPAGRGAASDSVGVEGGAAPALAQHRGAKRARPASPADRKVT